MQSFILQDWAGFAGSSAATNLTQDDGAWLDLASFQDATIYLEVTEVSTPPPTIAFQTSPTREDGLFQTLASITMSTGSQPNVLRGLMLGSSVPLARYLRWKISAGAAWDATFRALVIANSPGM